MLPALLNATTPLIAQFHPGLLYQQIAEEGKGEDDREGPQPVETIGCEGVQAMHVRQHMISENDDQWQVPYVEAKRNQPDPAKQRPFKGAFQRGRTEKNSGYTGSIANSKQHLA